MHDYNLGHGKGWSTQLTPSHSPGPAILKRTNEIVFQISLWSTSNGLDLECSSTGHGNPLASGISAMNPPTLGNLAPPVSRTGLPPGKLA